MVNSEPLARVWSPLLAIVLLVLFSNAFLEKDSLCIAERCYWASRCRAATCAPELVEAEL